MDRCLRIPDIVHNICTQIWDPKDLDYIFRKRRQTLDSVKDAIPFDSLYALARTSKLFSRISLDLMWHYQLHLYFLLKCLPPDTVKTKYETWEGIPNIPKLYLSRDIQGRDLERIMFYGQKIKILGNPTWCGIVDGGHHREWQDPLIIPSLLKALGNTSLFPNLLQYNALMKDFHSLCWTPRLVVGPSLGSMTFLSTRDSEVLVSREYSWKNLYTLISQRSPNLGTFAISLPTINAEDENDIEDMGESPDFSYFIQAFRAPEALEIVNIPLDSAALVVLSRKETLKRLHITLPSLVAQEFIQAQDRGTFKHLENLLLHVRDDFACRSILDTISSDRLSVLKIIRDHNTVSYWDINAVIRHIGDSRFMESLQQIEIQTANYLSRSCPFVSTITNETIQPILKCRDLRELRISLIGQVHIDRDTLDEITQAWPKLTVLDLGERTLERDFTPSITLHDFLAFSCALANLRELRLRVNARLDVEYAVYGETTGTSNLEIADFCTSPASNAVNIASILSCSLPSLRELKYGWRYLDANGDTIAVEAERDSLDEWDTTRDLLRRLIRHHQRS